ncbi:Perilipin-1 [Acipenser ruthenus]|uniref:Perilipin-1 n=1 Tax=Acipenser ruthenus TaxID=7906 RepID=A0A444UUQ7_ACIRT|nr:Perilipin-1 [Acipenser ruthenus]
MTAVIAVNSLACKGLDCLEDKIPALQYPPEKLASGIAEVVTNTVTTAKNGITSPIASTSDRALHLAASGYERTANMVTGTIDYILNTRPAKLAAEGMDSALTTTEKLVNYILPESQEEQGNGKQNLTACWYCMECGSEHKASCNMKLTLYCTLSVGVNTRLPVT